MISLGINQMSGVIPEAIGQLVALQNLYLGGNQLEGEIPPELSANDCA